MRLRGFVIPVAVFGLGLSVLAPGARALRVCADPDYAPYSNRSGEGFENAIAEAVAKALGEPLEYTWASYRRQGGFSQFIATTLDANKCDVVMSIPYGSRDALTTQPYYVGSYVFVFSKGKHYDIRSMDSPVLKKLKVGFERDTPPETGVMIRGMQERAVPFDVADSAAESPEAMLQAVQKGQIDVVITWQPAIGAFLPKYPDLEVIPVPNERAMGSTEQYAFPMSMGVREGNEALRKRLDDVISKRQEELTSILERRGVKLFTSQVPNLP